MAASGLSRGLQRRGLLALALLLLAGCASAPAPCWLQERPQHPELVRPEGCPPTWECLDARGVALARAYELQRQAWEEALQGCRR